MKKLHPINNGNNKVELGIPGFNDLIPGGIDKNSVVLAAGSAGSGKTIFALQFLVYGIEHNNETVMYITFEEQKQKLYKDMLKFGWDLAKHERAGKFIYLQYTPEQVKRLIVQGGGIIETIITDSKVKRLVIDSITSFALLYHDELEKKEGALKLFELLNKWGCTSLLTSQDESPYKGTISSALEFEVDGIILIYHNKIKGKRIRTIEVLKMRGTRISEKTVGLDITNKGLVIRPNKCVNI